MTINFNYLLFSGFSTKTWYPRFQSIPATTNITVVVDLVGIRELVAHQDIIVDYLMKTMTNASKKLQHKPTSRYKLFKVLKSIHF